jgi:hypothetical protein
MREQGSAVRFAVEVSALVSKYLFAVRALWTT